ncbi:hypothetical protein HHL22_00075 [Hymenobacter sp. RP-2-7]|uniref:Uncharacterized protein n=1 Tax=Hymenobacter polaris TaxID=2682546 RepID=A0A7Y0AA57_9BACT|nr:hypothetical protein [Hymenobacter polaris]NML63596.1 hypothetical protein [Hymenobacter polaris]
MLTPAYPSAPRPRAPHAARPAALAILYPKVGSVLRVPLRRTPTGGAAGCQQHPERQFMRWFNRMAAARPGFPMQLKSILLLTGEPLCASCRRALTRFLGQYQLAGKLRLQARGGADCSCARPPSYAPTLLDDWLATELGGELEGEGWWRRAADKGRALALAGLVALGPKVVPQAWVDMAAAAGEARQQRQRTQQVVEDNTPPSSRRRGQQGELSQDASDVVQPTIDVHAQYALQRLLRSPDPAARADGNALLVAVRLGEVRGIYLENQRVPAQWARRQGGDWWGLLAPPDDAAVLLSATPPAGPLDPPLLVLRDSIRNVPARLDPALRAAWHHAQQALTWKQTQPTLTPWQLKQRLLGQPVTSTSPAAGPAAVVGVGRAA